MPWLLGAGMLSVFINEYSPVSQILVTKEGLLPESFVETPDYYVIALYDSGKAVRSSTYTDIPIGNGLRFDFPQLLRPLRLANLCLMIENIISDKVIEQVEARGSTMRGQRYQFKLVRSLTWWSAGGYAMLIPSAGYLLLVLVYVVRAQAV
ncbi:hypothetical protein [Lacipirellula sp.]|uniref:hypothetical protein n=1 Tax=Lacipirellula sp. TaxID=2691419 RepID=UPI003D152C3B